MDKSDLIERIKVLLASAFSLSLKAQNYHWNVTGPNFGEYHKFFGKFYSATNDSVDMYAEHIRMLGVFTPGSLKRFSELSLISDEIAVPSPKFMFVRLAADNKLFISELMAVADMAEKMEERGLLTTLENQIQYHEKIQWMLTAYTE
jgi:starvation-inducible DNA-binding protein